MEGDDERGCACGLIEHIEREGILFSFFLRSELETL